MGGAGRAGSLPAPLCPQDTLRECAREDKHCLTYLPAISPIYFVTFVLVAQFVLVNVVVAVLMKHLEESNKEAREDAELDAELEMEMAQGSPARPRPAAPQSPGTSPDSPNVLVVRKVSVSRMLSLPNDSYMFRPVVPAAAAHPHPLQEVEMETYAGASGTAPGQRQPGPGRAGPTGRGRGGAGGAVGGGAGWAESDGAEGRWGGARGTVGAGQRGRGGAARRGFAFLALSCRRPGHHRPLAACGVLRLPPGPFCCVLPGQGWRHPLCPAPSGCSPLA